MRKIACFLLAFSLISACRKAEPLVSNDPVFRLDGKYGPKDLSFVAGDNNNYMLADYKIDPTDGLIFIADLGNSQSPTKNSEPKIVIEFTAFEGMDNVDSTIFVRSVPFLENSTLSVVTTHSMLCYNLSNGTAPVNFLWSFNNQTSIAANPEFNNLPTQFAKTITLTVNDGQQRTATQTHCLDYQNNVLVDHFIDVLRDVNYLVAIPSDSLVQDLKWSNGDTNLIAQIDSFSIMPSISATTFGGCKMTTSVSVNANSTTDNCIARFTTEATTKDSIVIQKGVGFGRVVVRYERTDLGPISSDLVAQPSDAFFQIDSVEDFFDNEAGKHTKKLAVRFSCDLGESPNGFSIPFKNWKGVIAIAYPK